MGLPVSLSRVPHRSEEIQDPPANILILPTFSHPQARTDVEVLTTHSLAHRYWGTSGFFFKLPGKENLPLDRGVDVKLSILLRNVDI